jgi:ubiquinone/menaquinone biosynthesis C-methylase UbiE
MTGYLRKNNDYRNPDIASAFDELSLWSSYFGHVLLENIPYRKNINVLDIGCGSGFPLFELAQRLGKTCTLYGVDLWKEAIQRAEYKKTVYGLSNVEIVYADAAHLPFEDNIFSLITCNLGINNMESPSAALKECYRTAKAGCTIALTTNPEGHMQEFYDAYETVLKEINLSHLVPSLEEQRKHRGTLESVKNLLEGAGFSYIKSAEDSFEIRYIDGTSMLNHFLTTLGFLDGWRSFLPEEEHERVFTALEERLNILAEIKGELKMTIPVLYIEAVK